MMTSDFKKSVILLLAPLPPDGKPGGIGTWTITILEELSSRADYEVIHIDTAVKWRSTTDKKLHKRLIGGILQGLYDAARAFRSTLKCKPDVLHLCSSGSLATFKDILILFTQKVLGVNTVIHYHMGRIPAIKGDGGWNWKLIQFAMSLADSVVVLDKHSELSLTVNFSHKIKRIPNAINLKHFERISGNNLCLPTSHVNIVYIGWAIRAKGLCELISACANISPYEFSLNIVGPIEQDFKNELEHVASKQGNSNWLNFIGPVAYIESLQYMNDADIFVLPSYTEGFPYVIAEAMALGKPIIATKVGAIPEMLTGDDYGECGLLIQPGKEDELRDAIVYLLEHPDEARALGLRASDRALSLYSIEHVFKQYDVLWKSLSVKFATNTNQSFDNI